MSLLKGKLGEISSQLLTIHCSFLLLKEKNQHVKQAIFCVIKIFVSCARVGGLWNMEASGVKVNLKYILVKSITC